MTLVNDHHVRFEKLMLASLAAVCHVTAILMHMATAGMAVCPGRFQKTESVAFEACH